MAKHLAIAGGVGAAVARDPDPQRHRMPGHRYITDPTLDGVAIGPDGAAAWATAWPGRDQIAEHHRRVAVEGGVGDHHPKFHGADDRVGNNADGRGPTLGHPGPR